MHSHLVAVKVRVEGGGDERVELDRRAFDQDRLKCLDTQTVQSRRTIQENGALPDDAFQRFPDLGAVALDEPARALDVSRVIILYEACDHKRTIQLECHTLRQTA